MPSSRRKLRDQLSRNLKDRARGRLHSDRCARLLYATDASIYMVEPLLAFVPERTKDAAAAVKLCSEMGVGLHPRGGATGLAGESLGEGLVLDCHPHFRSIHDLDLDAHTVRAGCGVTLDTLNRFLAPHGLGFGPDPSSGTRATIGGMVGTNATGTHSLQYGYTADHLLKASILTASDELVTLEASRPEDLPSGWREIPAICDAYSPIIDKSYPEQHRNRCGYRLKGLFSEGKFNPLPLFCGSEGTLGLLVEAKLGLVELPASKGLAMFLFDDLIRAAHAVTDLMPFAPAGLELIDNHVIRMGRRHSSRLKAMLPEGIEALLLVEWNAGSEDELLSLMEPALKHMRRSDSPAVEVREAWRPEDAAVLWLIRKEAEALILNQPGRRHAISFIEDTAVPFQKLGQWLETKRDILKRHSFDWATFGHAGGGELHSKVFVDLHDPADYKRLVTMAEELYEQVIELGGTISGEHGDGLSRSLFISRQYPELTPAFSAVKSAVDPNGIFNPGRKTQITGEHPALSKSRLSGRKAAGKLTLRLNYDGDEYDRMTEACHGCAACRSTSPSLRMCPLFRTSSEEVSSPRAIGNLARLMHYGPLSVEDRLGATAREAASLCFNCKMCTIECPSHVDIPKLALEMKIAQFENRRASLGERIILGLDALSDMATRTSSAANAVIRNAPARRLIETMTGIDRKAPLPLFDSGTLHAKISGIQQPATERKLLLYADSNLLYHDHQLALDFIELMNAIGWHVDIFTGGSSGLPALNLGAVDQVRRSILKQTKLLAPYLDQGVPIISTEPSAVLALSEDWPGVVDDENTRLLTSVVRNACDFLAEQLEGRMDLFQEGIKTKLAHHTPCHLYKLTERRSALELLESVDGISVTDLDSGCCGMAGSYGIMRINRRRSLDIGVPLIKAIAAGNFDGLVSECTTCRLQIAGRFPDMNVRHPIQVLAKAQRRNKG